MHANKPRKKRVLTKGERLSEAETERRQWWRLRSEREWETIDSDGDGDEDGAREWEWEWERDWDWEESQRVRERPRVRGNESETVYFETLCFLLRNFLSVWWPTGGLKWNRVLWTWFLGLQTEFNELGFWAYKPSSLDSVCKPWNRVQRTRFLGLQTKFIELDFWSTWTPTAHLSCWQNR